MPVCNTTGVPKIEALFRKPVSGEPMECVDTLNLIQSQGIEHDIARSEASPRQVLIVRQEDLDTFGLPHTYLKENLVVSGLSVNNFQPGRSIHFECGATIHLTFHCEPCKSIAELIPHLKSIIGRRGLLGIVTQSGRLVRGMPLESEKSLLDAMPVKPLQRACRVIARIPQGKVIDYRALLHAAGLQNVYFRAVPSYLKTAQQLGLPSHRVVTSRFTVPECLPEAAKLLSIELNYGKFRESQWQVSVMDVLKNS
jgi:alkylated DNA nucleotide flippase Atl1